MPGFVEEALTRERTATNILYRLKYVGSSDTCAVVAHKMRTDVVLMHYTLRRLMTRTLLAAQRCARWVSSRDTSGHSETN